MSRNSTPISIGEAPVIRFNILVVGNTGIGKTSFLLSLLRSFSPEVEISSFETQNQSIAEVGGFVNNGCEVTCFDSTGYGDKINNTALLNSIKTYLEDQHAMWLQLDKQHMTKKVYYILENIFTVVIPHT